jgi:hypothetical protein
MSTDPESRRTFAPVPPCVERRDGYAEMLGQLGRRPEAIFALLLCT